LTAFQTYVDFLNEFLRALESEKASLVGESAGRVDCGALRGEIGAAPPLITGGKLCWWMRRAESKTPDSEPESEFIVGNAAMMG